ncbi:hypothetical protein ACH4SK_13400 [Streptomyces inhibens]|uniref:hypothetical protein n=1 Tax=Streptomyces inhibens TaxID=2293571 RepID=UPI003787CB09
MLLSPSQGSAGGRTTVSTAGSLARVTAVKFGDEPAAVGTHAPVSVRVTHVPGPGV